MVEGNGERRANGCLAGEQRTIQCDVKKVEASDWVGKMDIR